MQSLFNPVIEFFHFNNGALGILFDPSGSSPEREAQVLEIPITKTEYENDEYPPCISIHAKNFNESLLGSKKVLGCEIYLVKDNTREYLLGQYQEIVESCTKGIFKRYNYFNKNLIEFEKIVRQKVSDNFISAWKNYIFQNAVNPNIVSGRTIYSSKKFSQNSNFNKLLAACILLPFILFAVVLIAKPKASDPIQQAVIDAIKNNPKEAQAQVDLTKDTLKQMGLDVGKAGDVGCLAVDNN